MLSLKDGSSLTTSWETTTDDELSALAEKWTTDKIKWYTSFYHSLLKDRRDAKKVLELGIGYPDVMWSPQTWYWPIKPYITGASLRMWGEYFPEATVYALDCNPNVLINEGRIKSFWCNQADPKSYPLKELGTEFDFIVEDGSHVPWHQLEAIKVLVPLLRPGGIYIAEDTGYMSPNEMSDFSAKIPYQHEVVEFSNPRLQGDYASCVVIRA